MPITDVVYHPPTGVVRDLSRESVEDMASALHTAMHAEGVNPNVQARYEALYRIFRALHDGMK